MMKVEPPHLPVSGEIYANRLVQVNRALDDLHTFIIGHEGLKLWNIEIECHPHTGDTVWVDLFAPLKLFVGKKQFKFFNVAYEAAAQIEQAATNMDQPTSTVNVIDTYR